MQLIRSITPIILFAGFIVGLSACGDDDDGGGGTTYNYTVTSTTFFTGGQQVAVIRFSISGSCSAPTGVTSAIKRVGAGTVGNPGNVSFSFKTEVTPPMFESVYIDNNASGNLDSGDRVWGDNPNDLFGACFNDFNTDQTFDWEVVAAQFQAGLGLSQPSIIYTGASQAFRSEPGSEPELMIDNAIIVDGYGYDSLQW
jgi:hypothetical protein